MKILMIGGTQFVGRAITAYALEQGHDITLLTRGQTNPDIFPEAKRITGDRDGGLDVLGDGEWDIVIDTCGYVPRIVQQSVDALKGKVKQYVFISTISVYAESEETNRDEDAELATLEDETTEEITGGTYGGLKVLCENAVIDGFGDNALIVRPGLVVGPYDPTNRFTYWVRRFAKGGDILTPGDADYPTQFIDTRDLAQFTVHLVEQGTNGIFNATGPAERLTLGDVFEACQSVLGTDATLHWATDEFLQEHEVGVFMEMPLWIPKPAVEAFNTISVQRGIDAGLAFRPLSETIQDTHDWVMPLGEDAPARAGMQPEREAELLEAMK